MSIDLKISNLKAFNKKLNKTFLTLSKNFVDWIFSFVLIQITHHERWQERAPHRQECDPKQDEAE